VGKDKAVKGYLKKIKERKRNRPWRDSGRRPFETDGRKKKSADLPESGGKRGEPEERNPELAGRTKWV